VTTWHAATRHDACLPAFQHACYGRGGFTGSAGSRVRLQALRDLELRNAALLAKLRQFTGEMADIELDQAWHGAAAKTKHS
jgi:hypothetical protein